MEILDSLLSLFSGNSVVKKVLSEIKKPNTQKTTYTIRDYCPVYLAKSIKKIDKIQKKRKYELSSWEEIDYLSPEFSPGPHFFADVSVICKGCKAKKHCTDKDGKRKELRATRQVTLVYDKK